MNTPNSVLCLTPTLFTSIDKFTSRVESLVLMICVLFCEHYNFNDLSSTCFVMFLDHS
jgi:hypothetical protein